jgi:xanthine dehydrogenase accessory factor
LTEKELGIVSVSDVAAQALSAHDGGEAVAMVVVIAAPADADLGRRLVVSRDAVMGTLGSADLDVRAAALAREALSVHARGRHRLESPDGEWELYVEVQRALPELMVVGAGHIARPLCQIASMIGFRVTVIDDRPEYANERWFPDADRVLVVDYDDPFARLEIGDDAYIVLVTRGHKYDYDCICQLLSLERLPAYLGMIGSRRRVRAAFEALVRDGVDPERLAEVHAPIGLDIGAETPEEIALAIAAELVAVRRGGRGGVLSGEEDVLGRVVRGQRRGRGR